MADCGDSRSRTVVGWRSVVATGVAASYVLAPDVSRRLPALIPLPRGLCELY